MTSELKAVHRNLQSCCKRFMVLFNKLMEAKQHSSNAVYLEKEDRIQQLQCIKVLFWLYVISCSYFLLMHNLVSHALTNADEATNNQKYFFLLNVLQESNSCILQNFKYLCSVFKQMLHEYTSLPDRSDNILNFMNQLQQGDHDLAQEDPENRTTKPRFASYTSLTLIFLSAILYGVTRHVETK